MASGELYTIGYQGRSMDSFLSVLKSSGVEAVADIREFPISRLKGFSKNQLSEALEMAGIGYVSIRELGSPRELRHGYRRTKNWDLFRREFQSILLTRENELGSLARRVNAETTCLLCFERESQHCHRSLVAEAIRRTSGNGLSIRHL